MPRILIAALVLLCCATTAEAKLVPLPPQPAGVAWPTQDWTVGEPRVDMAALNAAMDDAFGRKIPQLGETREVVIIQGGRLVHEQ